MRIPLAEENSAQNGARARLIKFVLTNSVALTVKQKLLYLKETNRLPVRIVAQAESMYRTHNSAVEPVSVEELPAADRKLSVTHVR